MDPTAVPAPLHVQAFFWTLSPQENEIKDSFKVKCCDVHPELPLVFSADKTGQLQVWDIFQHSLLMNCSVADIITATDNAKYTNVDERNRKVKEVGAVQSVRFVDKYALCWTTEKPPVDVSVTTFNNDTRVMIICDGGLLFYDYSSGAAHMLTQLELGKPATAAEFLAPNMCAIGCSDGTIRVWDCLSWSACKELSGHTKGNIVWLRVLSPKSYNPSPSADGSSRVSFDGSSAFGRGSADFSVASLLSTMGSHIKDEKPRLFSVGYDGGALLWDISVSASTVNVLGGSPAGHLLCVGCFAQYFDENSDTLYTVAADRTIRLWDLANIGKGAAGGVIRSARRRSSFLGTAAGTEAGKISCVGKAKPRADLSAPIAKFNSCTPLEHPRFPGGTFAVSGKTNAIGIVQIYESFGEDDAATERSSVTNSDSAAMKYHELHLFRMTSVLTAALVQLHEENPDMPISSAVIGACRDAHNLRVYSVQSHLLYPHVLIACTNLGVVALSLCAPSKAGGEGSRIGTHPSWGQNVVTYSDRTVKFCSMRVVKSLTGASGQTGTPSRPRSLRRRHPSRSIGGSTDLTNAAATPEDGVVLDLIADFPPSAAPVVPGGNVMPVGLDASTRGRGSFLAAQATRNCNLAVLSSRPVFYPSCTGLFCAAFWPESCIYVVFKVGSSGLAASAIESAPGTPTRRSFSRNGSNSTAGGEKMIEVERGMCYSVGWCAAAKASGEMGDVASDILCLISPAKKINAPKKRNSLVGDIFSSKKKESGAVLPSALILKLIHADLQVTEVLPDGAPKNVSEVIGGGAFVCLTTPITSQAGGGKKAVSQIELEAQAEERTRSRTASTAGLERAGAVEDNAAYSAIAPIAPVHKSQFFRVVYGVKVPENMAPTQSEPVKPVEAKSTPGAEKDLKVEPPAQPKFYLEPIGPTFQKILSVSWDSVSGHAALAMEATNRITVLSCGSAKSASAGVDNPETAPELSLSVVGSMQLSDGSSPTPLRCKTQHMAWSNGSLFVTTPTAIHVVFPIGGDGSSTQLKSYPVALLHQMMSDPTRAKSYFGAVSPQRPFGWLQSVDISAGHLVVASQAGALSAIPLTWSPVVAVGLVCNGVKYSNQALGLPAVLPWIDTVPAALRHDLIPLLEPLISDNKWDLTFGAASPEHVYNMLKENLETCSPGVLLHQHFLGDSQSGCVKSVSTIGPDRLSYFDSVLFALGQTLLKVSSSNSTVNGEDAQDAIELVRLLLNWTSRAGAGMSQADKLSLASIASVVARDTQISLAEDISSRTAAIVTNSERAPAENEKPTGLPLPSINIDSVLFESDLCITKFKVVS